MKLRNIVVIGLAVIATLAIASSAIEAKTKSKRGPQGPPGPAGAAGAAGANGAAGQNGSARAYGTVKSNFHAACSPNCNLSRSKGVVAVTKPGAGGYCINAPGLDPSTSTLVVSVEFQFTQGPDEGDSSALNDVNAGDCAAGEFEVRTERWKPSTPADAAPAENVGFSFMIP